ncbi:hypothetical protein BGX27_005643 [Mortierella sp. AM989]|nr:hypothetical protein BGX27_005643 [Mortierella sp. AM989]
MEGNLQSDTDITHFKLARGSLAASRTDFQLVESVTEHFKKWGPLLNVKVLKDWMQRPYSFVQFEARDDGTGNRRYAFAKFAYRDDAIRAYMSLRSNSRWTVEWAPNLSCQDQIEKESVFIGQLNPDLVTEAALRNRFKVYGDIQHIHLVKRNKPGTNRPTAFAFIEFDDENSAKEAIEQENNSTFLRTTIRVQHREASEYRMQRQNAAIQATRSLNVPHLVGSPPIEISTQPLNPMEYYGTYQPYQSPGPGRITFPSTYYTYPSPRMPMAGMGFVPVPQLSTVYLQQSGGPLRPTMANDGQGYYQGFMTYSNNPKITTMQHIASFQKGGIIRKPSLLKCTYTSKALIHSPPTICS